MFAIGLVAMAVVGLGPVSVLSASASEPELPVYSGFMVFPTIHSASDPEEFSWRVEVGPGQELKQVGEHVAVVYADGIHAAITIDASPAHDAQGIAVPTSIAVTGEDVVTLSVHHRAGNPAAGGVPFSYPIEEGPSYEIGPSSVIVVPSAPVQPVAAGAEAPVCGTVVRQRPQPGTAMPRWSAIDVTLGVPHAVRPG